MNLSASHCVPCRGDVPPMSAQKEDQFLKEVRGWKISRDGIHRISKEFTFDSFEAGIEFVNRVAELAEREGHHPDMHVSYKHVVIELQTHAIKGLSENDFIMAAKIDELQKVSV